MDESFEDIERKEGRGFRGRAVFLRAMEWVWKEFGRGSRWSPDQGGDRKTPCRNHTGQRAATGKRLSNGVLRQAFLGMCWLQSFSCFLWHSHMPLNSHRCLSMTLPHLAPRLLLLPSLSPLCSWRTIPSWSSMSDLHLRSQVHPHCPKYLLYWYTWDGGKAVWPDGSCTWPSWFLQSGPHSVYCSVYLPWPSFLSDVWHTTMNVLVVHDASVSLSILWPCQSKSYCSCIWCRRFWRW